MNLLKFSWKNITYKPLSSILNIGLFALAIGMIAFVLNVNNQVQEQFDRNLAKVQLIVGAKGSPLQLVLCNLFHIDLPTGNIALKEARPFLNPKHPWIETTVPLGLGDSYKGFRVVGTTPVFKDYYQLELTEGAWWTKSLEAVIGHNVARQSGLKIGDTFVSNHGIGQDDIHSHDEAPIVVTGIIAHDNSVVDNLILTSMHTVWDVHDNHDHGEGDDHDHAHDGAHTHDHDHDHDHDHGDGHTHDHDHDHDHSASTFNEDLFDYAKSHPDKEITSMLIRFKGTTIQALNMQRSINENTNMQAASPSMELNRLFGLLGIGITALQYIGLALLMVSGLAILLSLINSMQERNQEVVMMKIWGASTGKITFAIVLEGVIQAVVGALIGIVLAHIAIYFFNGYLESDFKYSIDFKRMYKEEWLLVALSVSIGVLGALIPAWLSGRKSLSENIK